MGKFSQALTDIYSIFSLPSWKAENIVTLPKGVMTSDATNEFIRVSIVPADNGINLNSVSGVLIIDIFTPAGKGQKRSFSIADTLEQYLAGKSIPHTDSSTQFFKGTLGDERLDKDNPSLNHCSYTIPFNHFGVF